MATKLPQVLFVLTSCNKNKDGSVTGWYLSEFAHPFSELKDAFKIHVASPLGGPAPLDPSSISAASDDSISTHFHATQSALWENTAKLSDFVGKAGEFEAIFYVGGHGPMNDLAKDDTSAKLIQEFAEKGKVVAAVCHGPAALTHPSLASYIKGERVTGFSNSEEKAVGKVDSVPFSLEDRLQEMSGKYEKGEDWGEFVVAAKEGRLLTGQNPKSAGKLARKVQQAVWGELEIKKSYIGQV